MTSTKFYCAASLLLTLSACGGGGSSSGTTTLPPTSYNFSFPAVNAPQVYTQTTVDNSGNTLIQNYSNTTMAINADGSGVIVNANAGNLTFNGSAAIEAVIAFTENENSSGQLTSETYTPTGGSSVTCTYSPHAAGPTFPITVGQTWSTTYINACSNSTPYSITQTGTVVDVESITVPAGTFSTVKLETVQTWTDAAGTIHKATGANWREVSTGQSVQHVTNYAYSGTAASPTAPVSVSLVLQGS